METITGFVGRARETEDALSNLQRGANVLVRGRAGIGKSAFLRHLYARAGEIDKPCAWVPAGSTKHALTSLCEQLHDKVGLAVPGALLGPQVKARAQRQGGLAWKDLVRPIRRLSVADTQPIILAALRKRPILVFIEALEVPPQQADLFGQIIEAAQVVAAMDDKNRRVRIDRLVWRFPVTVELKPLPLEDCQRIAEGWLDQNPVRFSDQRTRVRFLRHVAQDSGGVPAAVRGMLEAAEKEPEITPAMARGFSHEAGIRYVDMTPLVVLLIVAAMATRYISRGFGLQEMLVVSGVATALFTGVRFFLWQMRRRI